MAVGFLVFLYLIGYNLPQWHVHSYLQSLYSFVFNTLLLIPMFVQVWHCKNGLRSLNEYSGLISFRTSSYQRSPLPKKSDLLLLQNDAHLYPHKLSLLHTPPHNEPPIHPEPCNSQRDPQLPDVQQSKNGLETWKRTATPLSECYRHQSFPLQGSLFSLGPGVTKRLYPQAGSVDLDWMMKTIGFFFFFF